MKLKQKIKLFFVDKLTEFLLQKQQINIKKITDEKELNDVRHFIFKIYAIEKKYINPTFFPNRMFTDEFNGHSIYFSAFKKKKIIGTIRLVLNSSLGLPIEKVYRLTSLQTIENKTAELSRLIVINGPWNKTLIALALCKYCFKESLKLGITHWYAFMPEKLKNHFEQKYRIPFIELKTLPLTDREKANRKPYLFYFIKYNPKPYLIPLGKLLDNFKI